MNSRLRKNERCPIHGQYYCCGRTAERRNSTSRVIVGADGHLREICSPAELRRRKNALIEKQQYKCATCQEPFTHYSDAELDHILARKMGGGFRDDSVKNLQVLCKPCHRAKHEGRMRA